MTRTMTRKVLFAAGCFWGVEEVFRKQHGVIDTAVGYAGGSVPNPTYEQVCTDTTGHAEVVLVEYDPSEVSFVELLNLFWQSHDPTQGNRQGPDVGSQYRSAIYCFEREQFQEALSFRKQLEEEQRFPRPITTEIEMASHFYRAEEYHQRYLQKQGRTSCGF
ncbi:MAG: peptide-methionine (S)-S-oxide reductase MsrA [Bdellovibrionales bacterium]|nr:peptide-methionine (S)-S-oxide reductase MsrA [Bdellovibrionales bacterium]